MYTAKQIRQKFLDYFGERQHQFCKSSSLIPQNDPSLYFTNAGMVPFKNFFTGEDKSSFHRAVSCQKCMRVSGKHNDLENVGRTARHHTFFEMLGNFSFGDYFKKEAIAMAWEFLTENLKLNKDKLWVTVYEEDDEAEKIWHDEQKVPLSRIVRMGKKDNFWSMGDLGPCGPCSEIHFEQNIPCTLGNKDCAFGKCDCDRYIEIWNLVFMQYEKKSDGTMHPLPQPSIDTGMGLERLVAVLQGKVNNYDSDLFALLFKKIEQLVGIKYGRDENSTMSMRVLADHIRATVFLIADGVLPSNEGRGYVLRRIMRRAIRHGKLLGQVNPFFFQLVDPLVEEMSQAYPELLTHQHTIKKIIEAEEIRFFETLEKGLKLLSEEIRLQQKTKMLSGEMAFKLYDTYGFPLDLTEIICQENGFGIDLEGFDKAMLEQKQRARAGWKGSGEDQIQKKYFDLAQKNQTVFLGYDTLETPAKVVALLQNGEEVTSVTMGDCEIIFDQTPFYAEGGGQVGDCGVASTTSGVEMNIHDTQKPVPALFVHHAKVVKGVLSVGDIVQLTVFREVRKATMRNHTATHLLHAALRHVLGNHVRQAGSLVNQKMLRFDFSHFEAITTDDLNRVENLVNEIILQNQPVVKEEMPYDLAVQKGALAFFGDKYGDQVRVVSVGQNSIELCGGTHVNTASEIGFVKIISEGSVAAGVRRLEAITGEEAIKLAQKESNVLKELSNQLKVSYEEIPNKIDKLQLQLKSLHKEIERLNHQALRQNSEELLKNSIEINGVRAVFYVATVNQTAQLKEVSDVLMEKLKSGIAVVAAIVDDKPSVMVSVSPDLQNKFPAQAILKQILPLIEGRGGGKADRAQAGGLVVDGLQKISPLLEKILVAPTS